MQVCSQDIKDSISHKVYQFMRIEYALHNDASRILLCACSSVKYRTAVMTSSSPYVASLPGLAGISLSATCRQSRRNYRSVLLYNSYMIGHVEGDSNVKVNGILADAARQPLFSIFLSRYTRCPRKSKPKYFCYVFYKTWPIVKKIWCIVL